MSRYKVIQDAQKGGYVIHCYDGDYSHAIDLLFHDEEEAEIFAKILTEETQEAFSSGQISTI